MPEDSNDTSIPGEDDVRDLFERTTPVGTDTEFRSLVTPSRRANVVSQTGRGESWFRITTLAGLAGVIALLLVSLQALRPKESLAFETVKATVQNVKTLQFTSIRVNPDRDFSKSFTRLRELIIDVRDRDKEKSEERIKQEAALQKMRRKANRPQYSKVMILGRYLKRTEHLNENGHYTVEDMASGKSMSVDPGKKIFTVFNHQIVMDTETGKTIEDRSIEQTPHPEADFYREFRQIPTDAIAPVGEALVGNRRARGFKRIEKNGLETWTRIYWVDVDTHLPVRIEVSYHSLHPTQGDSEWVLTDFVFDEPLDRALFPVEPPRGYTLSEGKIMGLHYVSPVEKSKKDESKR